MKFIDCPHCKQLQVFECENGVWFPTPPFCCEIMRNSDEPFWNLLLDAEIAKVAELIQ